MSLEQVLSGIETKEGLMLIIQEMINTTPNDQELGEMIRKNFKDYLEQE